MEGSQPLGKNVMSKIQWDSQLYLRYELQRTQPSIDLASRIDLDSPAAIIDLGCGPGNTRAFCGNGGRQPILRDSIRPRRWSRRLAKPQTRLIGESVILKPGTSPIALT